MLEKHKNRIRKCDDKLLKREKSIRSGFNDMAFMAVCLIITECVLQSQNHYEEQTYMSDEMKAGIIIAVIALCGYYQVLCRHVDSIKLYRKDVSLQDDSDPLKSL